LGVCCCGNVVVAVFELNEIFILISEVRAGDGVVTEFVAGVMSVSVSVLLEMVSVCCKGWLFWVTTVVDDGVNQCRCRSLSLSRLFVSVTVLSVSVSLSLSWCQCCQ